MVPFWSRFCAVVARHPHRPALESAGNVLSYAALRRRAAELGAALREAGVAPGERVGLHIGKSCDYVVALLACWAAGAAFVPLDPRLPEARLRWLVADAGLRWAVSWRGLPGVRCLAPDSRADAELPDAEATGPAYVIYTSGSSGTPKGVVVGHGGVINLLDAQIAAFELTETSRSLLYLSISFDASLSDIGTTLLAGACLCIDEQGADLPQRLAELHITHVDIPPALLRLLDPEVLPPALSTLIIGGEVCPPEVVRRHARHRRVINVYGPTEATVCVSLCVCEADKWQRPLLGQPLPGVQLRVSDPETGAAVPPGTAGELWIAGPALALGYVGQAALTAARFVHHDGQRWYRSGDRVVEDGHGELEFLGRYDRQLKLRGRLVAPEEVEAALLRCPGIQRAAVVLDASEPPKLVAYVEGEAQPHVLWTELGLELPPWLVPQRVVRLPHLPETSTGKIDMQALAQAVSADDFEESGGDSLTALEAGARVAGLPLAELRADALSLLAPSSDDGALLLTGATGRLGRHLLRELLRSGARPIYCLVRKPKPATAGVTQLIGDITLPQLGLADDVWSMLVDSISEIHHLAAQLHAALPYSALRATNVVGTRHVLALCHSGRPKRLHHASTLSVVLQAVDGRIFGGYAQSKAAAEALLQDGHWCHRLGLLTAPALSEISKPSDRDDLLSSLLRGLVALGGVPEGLQEDLRIDMTPVDWAAAVLEQRRRAPPGQDDICAPYGGVSLGELVRILRLPLLPLDDLRRRTRGRDARTAFLALNAALPGPLPPARRPGALFFPELPRPTVAGPALPPRDELLHRYLKAFGLV